ncbi:hypothetical protein EBX93_14505 [bacterium]|nr:hypothetical protein [bacterium]
MKTIGILGAGQLARMLAISGIPLGFKFRFLDPATSSTPFVATLVDVTGLLIYFAACMAFLKGTIL